MFSCTFCAKTFQAGGDLRRHVLSHTKEKPHKCLICGATFGLKSNMRKHIQTVHDDGVKRIKKRNTQCLLCSYTCCDKSKLQNHLLKHSSELPFSCNMPSCGYKTKYKHDIKRHVRVVHSNERPYQCSSDGCNYKAKCTRSLKNHLKVHSNEKPFVCKVPGCNYSCKFKVYLNSHISRAHSDEKPFKCSVCDFRAKFKRDITGHQRIHMKTKRFKCQAPNCGFSNNLKRVLAHHFDAKHRKKDIRCTQPGCNYLCSSMTLLKLHRKGHELPILKCPGDECHFSTRFKQYLLTHISRFHEDIQPATMGRGPRKCGLEIAIEVGVMDTLQCGVPNCSYQTKFRHHYDRHRITHEKEEKWQHVCPFCFSRFSKLQILEYHVKRHVREKPYSCSFCKYTAVSGGELKSHAAKIHHIHVNPRGKDDEVRKCRTCGRVCFCYSEFVVHSMTHLQAVVVLEKLNLQAL